MKKLINPFYIAAFTGCLLMIPSCQDDFLEEQPPGTLAGDVILTGTGVEALLIGAYNSLFNNGSMFGGSTTMWEWGSISSDDAGFGAANAFHAVESYEMLPNNSYPAERWRESYNGVMRCNDVLTFLWQTQETDNRIPEERARTIEAEAKFLRAFHHFQLQLVFFQIPYIKNPVEMDGRDPATIPNDSEAWDGIEADLTYAMENLPEEMEEVGRANKFSAMAMKARAHLFQQEFGEAKLLLDNIINSGRFRLVDNYYDNYMATTENNEESIFEIQANVSAAAGGANTLPVGGMSFHQNGPAAKGWGAFQPTQNLFNAFQVDQDGLPILEVAERENLANDMGVESSEEFHPTEHLLDPRVDWTIARRGIPFLGWGVHEGKSWIRSQNNGGPYMTKKYMHRKENDGILTAQGGFKNARNFRAYRYAHVLLWRAEVAVEENDFEYARQLVNMVRERAQGDFVMGRALTYIFDGRPIEVNWDQPAANYKISAYPVGHVAFSSQDMARKAVRLELRLEFATEGMRFFQLRRWGIDGEVLNDFIREDSQFRPFMRGTSYDPEVNDYWPLPQAQLDIQTGVLDQDPAYR